MHVNMLIGKAIRSHPHWQIDVAGGAVALKQTGRWRGCVSVGRASDRIVIVTGMSLGASRESQSPRYAEGRSAWPGPEARNPVPGACAPRRPRNSAPAALGANFMEMRKDSARAGLIQVAD